MIVMDNASFHKGQETKAMIEAADHILDYLPPYSHHLNPIKAKWVQAKG